jgi:hypothetical protein
MKEHSIFERLAVAMIKQMHSALSLEPVIVLFRLQIRFGVLLSKILKYFKFTMAVLVNRVNRLQLHSIKWRGMPDLQITSIKMIQQLHALLKVTLRLG